MFTNGTKATQEFYDEAGWKTNEFDESLDRELFGVKEDGPIRARLDRARQEQILSVLRDLDGGISLMECGCGGSPAAFLIRAVDRYTGVDFSKTGIDLARKRFETVSIPHTFSVADVCNLQFDDDQFDAIYSAHMLYHIEDPSAQYQALQEMQRVLKPGGVLLLHVANPRPFLFPLRALMRIVASSNTLKRLARQVRGNSPLPYNPQSISWTKSALSGCKSCEVVTGGIPSTKFNQNVSEYRLLGKQLWHGVAWLETAIPSISAYLGNYVIYICRK